jgi:cytoskeletal protein CcmA (bactofilin family)
MFNKPNLFPKANETPAARSGRIAPGGSVLSGSPGAQQEHPAGLREPNPVSGHAQGLGAASSSGMVTKSSPEVLDKSSGSSLIVGPEVKLKGAEILDCDTLVVEGRVEATMDSRVIRIAEHGAFAGTVCIDVAEIHGQFDGELVARSQLIIHATGRVSGKIRYGKILIEEGGEISGDIKAIEASTTSRKSAEPDDAMSKSSAPVATGTNG